MDLNDVHELLRVFLNDEQSGKHSPGELDGFLHRAQMWELSDKFDLYSKTQKLHDSLSVFSTKFQFTSAAGGLIQLPIDEKVNPCYEHLLSVWIQYYDNAEQRTRYKAVKMINEDELPDRLDSQILEPTVTDPVGVQPGNGKIQLYPETAMSGYGFYLRRPLKPDFKFSKNGRDIIYNPTTSTQLEWKDSSMNKILMKALQFAGVNVDDKMIMQYTEAKNQQDI